MPRNDSDIAKSVREVMEKKGVEIRLNVRTQSIHDTHDGVTLTYSDTSDGTPYFVDGDAILIATGRKPMIEGLNLQAAGVEVDAHGAIVVNDQLHTNAPHIWAMGDVKGGSQFTYLSLDDFRQRTKVSKTVIDLMAELGLFGNLPQSNQLSLFDFS